MSAFGGLVLTNKGRNLFAKVQAGAQQQFTRIALGDGDLGTSSMVDLSTMKHQAVSLPVTELKALTDGKVTVGAYFSNSALAAGFYWREIGIFAQDPDIGEILYCYGNAGTLAEYIPAAGGPDVVEKNVGTTIIVGNAANVSAVIDQSLVYASAADLNAHTGDRIVHITAEERNVWDAKANATDFNAHKADGTAHITTTERNAWNAKETPVGAQQKATTAENNSRGYTDSQITQLLNAAPAALDTLKELANALGNDPSFATTITNLISQKVAKAGDTMTGDLTIQKGVAALVLDALRTNKSKIQWNASTSADFGMEFIVDGSLAFRVKSDGTLQFKKPDSTWGNVQDFLTDYVRQPGYAVTTGTANTYAITLNPAPTAYTEGMAVAIKINIANTSTSTLNINGLGAKMIKKANGTDVSSGNIKAGSIYTLRYNGTNFILQGEGGSGNAVAADLLFGKTANTDAGDISGSMVNNGVVNLYPQENHVPVSGYYALGSVILGEPNFLEEYIPYGIDMWGKQGSYDYEATNPITAATVLAGKVGFVNGAKVVGASTAKKWASGTITPTNYTGTVNNLTFTPSLVYATYITGTTTYFSIMRNTGNAGDKIYGHAVQSAGNGSLPMQMSTGQFLSNGFTMQFEVNSTYNYIAIE